jgi:hypothetical protein
MQHDLETAGESAVTWHDLVEVDMADLPNLGPPCGFMVLSYGPTCNTRISHI